MVAIGAEGHTASGWITDKNSTCTAVGLKHKECTVCHEVLENAIIDLKAHTYISAWSKDEALHWHECSTCGSKSELEVHTWDDGIIVKQPTTTEFGSKTYSCTVCGGLKTETIDKFSAEEIASPDVIPKRGCSCSSVTFSPVPIMLIVALPMVRMIERKRRKTK